MAFEFHYTFRVEFHETDLAGIVHFSNYFRYMEAAEHAFLRGLGLSVHGEYDGQPISFPRVKAECSYLAPLRFEDEVDVHLVVKSVRRSAVTYGFLLARRGDPQPAGRGSVTAVCVTLDPATRQMRATAIPGAITRQVEAAPAEVLQALFPDDASNGDATASQKPNDETMTNCPSTNVETIPNAQAPMSKQYPMPKHQ